MKQVQKFQKLKFIILSILLRGRGALVRVISQDLLIIYSILWKMQLWSNPLPCIKVIFKWWTKDKWLIFVKNKYVPSIINVITNIGNDFHSSKCIFPFQVFKNWRNFIIFQKKRNVVSPKYSQIFFCRKLWKACSSRESYLVSNDYFQMRIIHFGTKNLKPFKFQKKQQTNLQNVWAKCSLINW